MLGAAVGKLRGLDPYVATWTLAAGAAWLFAGAWRLSRRVPRLRTPRAVQLWGIVVLAVADGVARLAHGYACRATCITTRRSCRSPASATSVERLDWFTVQRSDGEFTNMPLAFIPAGVGVWIGGFDVFWARLPDVVLGILSVWLLFDGLWRVSTLRLAVVAALLLAANHCHIAFSRMASTYIDSAFVVSLLFALFSRLWTAPTYLGAVALAVSGVLGMQTYHASFAALPLAGRLHAAARAAAAAALACRFASRGDLRGQRRMRGGDIRRRGVAGARPDVHAQQRDQHFRARLDGTAAARLSHRLGGRGRRSAGMEVARGVPFRPRHV